MLLQSIVLLLSVSTVSAPVYRCEDKFGTRIQNNPCVWGDAEQTRLSESDMYRDGDYLVDHYSGQRLFSPAPKREEEPEHIPSARPNASFNLTREQESSARARLHGLLSKGRGLTKSERRQVDELTRMLDADATYDNQRQTAYGATGRGCSAIYDEMAKLNSIMKKPGGNTAYFRNQYDQLQAEKARSGC